MHAQIQIFLSERRERGGVGSNHNGEKTEKTALIFFMFVLGFFGPKFSGGGGPTIYEGGPNANFYRI